MQGIYDICHHCGVKHETPMGCDCYKTDYKELGKRLATVWDTLDKLNEHRPVLKIWLQERLIAFTDISKEMDFDYSRLQNFIRGSNNMGKLDKQRFCKIVGLTMNELKMMRRER